MVVMVIVLHDPPLPLHHSISYLLLATVLSDRCLLSSASVQLPHRVPRLGAC